MQVVTGKITTLIKTQNQNKNQNKPTKQHVYPSKTKPKNPQPPTKKKSLPSIYFHVLVEYMKFIFFIVNLAIAYFFMNKFYCFCSENSYDIHIFIFSKGNTLCFWDYHFPEHAVPYWISPLLCSRFGEYNKLDYSHFLITEGGKYAQVVIVYVPMDTPFQWKLLFSILLDFKHPVFLHFVNIISG